MDDVKKIIEVFDDYNKNSDYYEIFFSRKIGYFALILDELTGEQLDTVDHALWFYYNQFVIDYKIEKANGGNVDYSLTDTEKQEVFQHISRYTKKLEPKMKEYADKLLCVFFDSYGK